MEDTSMRIRILADVGEGITLPINYNRFLTGIIYKFLSESDSEYATFLHDGGYAAESKLFKLFTFSQLMAKRRRISGANIRFGSSLTWYVSSPMAQFLQHFADTLLSTGVLALKQHRLPIEDVSLARVPRFREEMEFRCLSPVVMTTVRDYNGQQAMHYCRPDDPAFSELVRQNLLRKHEAIHGTSPSDDRLTFRFDDSYIRKRAGKVTRLIDYRGVKIKGVLCPFRVSGSPALIQTGYDCGFGDKNSVGFGMAGV